MVQIVQARDISLEELKQQFHLQLASDQGFFDEWKGEPISLSPFEVQQLGRIQRNYAHLSELKRFSEEAVKMVVLSPLLDLADFYQAPFGLVTEESVELVSEDEGVVVKGKIDVLVVKQGLWILVVESKSTQFDVLSALPQALAYMLDSPNKKRSVYGLLVNGREFVFVKLQHKPAPLYARSFALSVERDRDLAQVLSMLKSIRHRLASGDA